MEFNTIDDEYVWMLENYDRIDAAGFADWVDEVYKFRNMPNWINYIVIYDALLGE